MARFEEIASDEAEHAKILRGRIAGKQLGRQHQALGTQKREIKTPESRSQAFFCLLCAVCLVLNASRRWLRPP